MGSVLASEAASAMTFAEYVRRERRVEVEWHAASMTLRVRVNRSDGTVRAVAVTDLQLVESRLSPVELIAREVRGNPLDAAAVRLLAKDELHAQLGTVPGVRTALLRQPRAPVFLGVDVGTGDRTAIVASRGGESGVVTAESFRRAAEQINQAWREFGRAVEDAGYQPARHVNTLRTWRGVDVPDGPPSYANTPDPGPNESELWRRADGRPDWQGIMTAINDGRLGMTDAARIVEQLSPAPPAPSAIRVRPTARPVERPPSDATPLAPVNRNLPIYKPR